MSLKVRAELGVPARRMLLSEKEIISLPRFPTYEKHKTV